MKSAITRLAIGTACCVMLGAPVGALAGQPNQSCEDNPTTPGNAASAPGSAFNTDGKAGTVYAGEQPQNSKNPKSVSQYDVACTHQPSTEESLVNAPLMH